LPVLADFASAMELEMELDEKPLQVFCA